MALGGGTWLFQNKKLPGTYINFVSRVRASTDIADRGYATMPLELDWGPVGSVFAVTADDGSEDLGKSGRETADNTGAIKEAMEISDEDLKYLREAAEQEAINQYTTATVQIDMGGVNNNISNGMDLDGVMTFMTDGLLEAMAAGAEAVHPT